MNHTIKTTGGAIKVRPYSGGAFVMLEMIDHYGATHAREILAPESAAAVVIAFEQVLGSYEPSAPVPAPAANKWAGSKAHFEKLMATSCNENCNQGRDCTCGAVIVEGYEPLHSEHCDSAAPVAGRFSQRGLIAAACAWGVLVIGSAASAAHFAGAL